MKSLLLSLALAVVLAGCSKKDDAAPKKDPVAKPDPKAEPKPTPKPDPEPTADPDADYVKVTASHAKPKPSDPDVFTISSFKIVKSAFDPANVEGGTADLELDLASLASNSARRDADIKGPDYLDVDQFSTVAIHVDNVKKTAEGKYSADATVNAHGIEKKLPVEFEVLSSTPDGIRIKGTHTFKRLDFAIGAPEGEDSVGADVTIEMQLTFKKTA